AHLRTRSRGDRSLVRGQLQMVGAGAQRRLPAVLRASIPRPTCLGGLLRSMRVLITGANGLLGSRLCLSFLRRGHQVFGVSRSPTRPPLPPKPVDEFTYQQCDLTDQAQLVLPFEAARPDVVVHPASMTDVDRCQREPASAHANNVVATLNIAD